MPMLKHPHAPHRHHEHHYLAPHEHPYSVTKRICELIAMKSPQAALNDILKNLALQCGMELPTSGSVLDIAANIDLTIANQRKASMEKMLAIVNNGTVLGAGEIPPDLINAFLKKNIHFTQIHEAHRHDDMPPPHATHFLRKYATLFEFAVTINHVVGITFNVILVHAFEHAGELFVPPLAAVVTQLYATVPLVAIRAQHQAPHHRIGLGNRQPTFFIEE